jgi:peptide/nickel transport system substrate-binding protein
LDLALLGVLLAASCAPAASSPPATGQPGAQNQPQGPARVKRVTAAMMGEPTAMIDRMNATQITVPGGRVLEMLVNASLTEMNAEAKLQPLLAEAVPTLENGQWKLLPDGRMETTWKIRAGAAWHDGTPLTADDFVFTTTVDQDKEIPFLRPLGYSWVEQVAALDPRTVTVTWSSLYIDADTMFTGAFASPLPKHLLQPTFTSDRTAFQALPFWNQEFVGTGPFRLRQFTPGASVVLVANDAYTLGRPKVDEIEVRFILDANTLVTNLLANSVELTLGRGFSVENAIQLRDQWRDGRMIYRTRLWIALHPQFINPSPAVVGDVRFRQALLHGTDRQQLVDSLQGGMGGMGGVGHVLIGPAEPEYADVKDSVTQYEYDPRRTAQILEGMGYTRGSDGGYRDGAGTRLSVEIRSNGERITENAIVPVTNMWNQLGVSTEQLIVPIQRISDREYVSTFPGFRMMRQPNAANSLSRLRSNLTPTAENRYVGSNYARYQSPEFDALIDRFYATIPRPERIEMMRQIMRHISDNLNLMGLFYDGDFMFAHNRLQNVNGNETEVWNVHQWDART